MDFVARSSPRRLDVRCRWRQHYVTGRVACWSWQGTDGSCATVRTLDLTKPRAFRWSP